jgi:hypothetical protein
MTRLILSYLSPFELETIVTRLNTWSRTFIKRLRSISLLYNNKDTVINYLTANHQLLQFNLESKNIDRMKAIQGIPKNHTKYSYIEDTNNRIFILGGYDTSAKEITSFLYVIEKNVEAKEMSTAHCERLAFSLVILRRELFVVGGFNEGTLKICEKMDINTFAWKYVPALNMKRCSPIVCTFDNNTIYAFGGTDGYSPLNSAEKLSEGVNYWETLPDFCQFNSPQLRIAGMAHQISTNEIMIFGGYKNNRKEPAEECLIYNVQKRCLTAQVKIPLEARFIERGAIYLEREKLFVLAKNVFLYNAKKKEWSMYCMSLKS